MHRRLHGVPAFKTLKNHFFTFEKLRFSNVKK
jgi:hypothetical protein